MYLHIYIYTLYGTEERDGRRGVTQITLLHSLIFVLRPWVQR